MNIWIFNHYATSPDMPGGSRHYDIAQYLIKRGHEVTIIASSFHYNTYKEYKNYPNNNDYIIEKIDNIRYLWVKTFPYSGNNWKRHINILSFTFRLRKVCGLLFGEKPDVVLGSSFHLFTPLAAYWIARKHNIPFVLEVRDLWPETLRALGASSRNPLVILLSRIEKYLYKRSDHVVVVLPKAHEYILGLDLGVQRAKISWIPNGVNFGMFLGSSKDQAEPSIFNPEKFNVLNAGSLGNVYNLHALIYAAKILQEKGDVIHISLVGNGPLELELKELVKSLRVRNVSFFSQVSKSKISKIMEEADALYASLMDSPLYKYGMSLNKIHEYMAIGKPIIFSVNTANNPVEEAGAGVTVDPNSPDDIARGILAMHQSSDSEKLHMRTSGRNFAKRNFDSALLAGKFEDIFVSLI